MRTQSTQHTRVLLDPFPRAGSQLEVTVEMLDGRVAVDEWVKIDGMDCRLSAEQLERIAAALALLRQQGGDARRCCPDHGYYFAADHEGCGQCARFAVETQLAEAALARLDK